MAPRVAEQGLSELPDSNLFQLLAHINKLQDKEPTPPAKENPKV